MSVSYHRLWKVLIDEDISHTELRQRANISPNTMTKLFHNEKVSMDILERICDTLQVDFGDIVEFVPNDKSWGFDKNADPACRKQISSVVFKLV